MTRFRQTIYGRDLYGSGRGFPNLRWYVLVFPWPDQDAGMLYLKPFGWAVQAYYVCRPCWWRALRWLVRQGFFNILDGERASWATFTLRPRNIRRNRRYWNP